MNLNYFRIFRYIAFFITLAFLIFAFNVYVANYKLEQKIIEIKKEIENYEMKKRYYSNFLIPFLNSQIWQIIFFHKNGIPLTWEKIVIIQNSVKKPKIEKKNVKQVNNITLWYMFLKEKIVSNLF